MIKIINSNDNQRAIDVIDNLILDISLCNFSGFVAEIEGTDNVFILTDVIQGDCIFSVVDVAEANTIICSTEEIDTFRDLFTKEEYFKDCGAKLTTILTTGNDVWNWLKEH